MHSCPLRFSTTYTGKSVRCAKHARSRLARMRDNRMIWSRREDNWCWCFSKFNETVVSRSTATTGTGKAASHMVLFRGTHRTTAPEWDQIIALYRKWWESNCRREQFVRSDAAKEERLRSGIGHEDSVGRAREGESLCYPQFDRNAISDSSFVRKWLNLMSVSEQIPISLSNRIKKI